MADKAEQLLQLYESQQRSEAAAGQHQDSIKADQLKEYVAALAAHPLRTQQLAVKNTPARKVLYVVCLVLKAHWMAEQGAERGVPRVQLTVTASSAMAKEVALWVQVQEPRNGTGHKGRAVRDIFNEWAVSISSSKVFRQARGDEIHESVPKAGELWEALGFESSAQMVSAILAGRAMCMTDEARSTRKASRDSQQERLQHLQRLLQGVCDKPEQPSSVRLLLASLLQLSRNITRAQVAERHAQMLMQQMEEAILREGGDEVAAQLLQPNALEPVAAKRKKHKKQHAEDGSVGAAAVASASFAH